MTDLPPMPLTDDPIVDEVIGKFMERSSQGMERSGMSMADNKASVLEWIDEAQQEAMDLCLYLERLKKEFVNGRPVRIENSPSGKGRQDILDKDRSRFSNEGEGWVQSDFGVPPDTAA